VALTAEMAKETIYYILKLGKNTRNPDFTMKLGSLGRQKIEPARDEKGDPFIFDYEGYAGDYLNANLDPLNGWFTQAVRI